MFYRRLFRRSFVSVPFLCPLLWVAVKVFGCWQHCHRWRLLVDFDGASIRSVPKIRSFLNWTLYREGSAADWLREISTTCPGPM
jgi:hypothetical protein